MNTHTHTQTHTWAGILLVLATGLMHGVEGPANYHEAAYKGLLFFLNAAGALVAARGISRGATLWGWTLGLLLTDVPTSTLDFTYIIRYIRCSNLNRCARSGLR